MPKMKKAPAIALSAAVVVAAAAGAWFTVPYEANVVHAAYAVDLSTPELAAGWADDVFVASVESQESAERDADGLLYTPFTVSVQSTLQGSVSGDIRVVQEGGDDPVSREKVVFDGATPLQPGKTYVLATRLSSQDGWHVAPSNFTPVEVTSSIAANDVLAKWKTAVAAPQSQARLHPSDVDTAANPAPLYKRAEAS